MEKAIKADPEVRSYIYQQIAEFEPFVTQNTQIVVLSSEENPAQGSKISIILKEGDTEIRSESQNPNIYEAVREAKEVLLRQLEAIQDSLISPQERLEQIQLAAATRWIH